MSITSFFGNLGNIIGKMAGDKLEEKYSGRIPDNRVFRRDPQIGKIVPSAPGPPFAPDQTYLQVTINHMFVTQARELWVEREQFGAVWMGLRYNGIMQSIPFILGRDMLMDKVQKLPKGARIEFSNVRISRVYPYVGDNLALYLGLWSAPTEDWAAKAFGALDLIAGKVKFAASLSQVLDMVDVLNQGISTILGINQVKAHLNLYQEFQQPGLGSDVSVLQPGYYVMINAPKNAPRAEFDPDTLAVLDNRLFIWNGQNLEPESFHEYDRYDFLLYNIASLTGYPAVIDIYNKQYVEIWKALIESKMNPDKLKEARQLYYTLLGDIVANRDLTDLEKSHLLVWFKDKLNKESVQLAIDAGGGPVFFGAVGAGNEATVIELPKQLQPPPQREYEAYRAKAGQSHQDTNLLLAEAAARFSGIMDEVGGN